MSEVEDIFVRGDEAVKAKTVRYDPRPSELEVEEHNITHLPYRSWCPHCVRGKAPAGQHRKRNKQEKVNDEVPVVSMDYCYMQNNKDDEKEDEEKVNGNPTLVTSCRRTKMVFASGITERSALVLDEIYEGCPIHVRTQEGYT